MATADTRIVAPHRTCIGCRQSLPQAELVRCTIDAHGTRVSRTAAGRGAWLCSMRCYKTALHRKAFDRSWRRTVSTDELTQLGDALRAAFDEDMRESSRKG